MEYIAIHRQLFTGIYKFAGKIRDYNISKNEWVLNGKSVLYANATEIGATLDYDFNQENNTIIKTPTLHNQFSILHNQFSILHNLFQIFGKFTLLAREIQEQPQFLQ